jgi:hypothetical protein
MALSLIENLPTELPSSPILRNSRPDLCIKSEHTLSWNGFVVFDRNLLTKRLVKRRIA